MTSMEDREFSSVSPDTDGRSETDEFDRSSIASVASTAALRVSFDLHRHNTQLLRDKQELELKHNDEVLGLRRQILELEQRLSQLTAAASLDAAKQQTLNEMVRTLSERNNQLEIDLKNRQTSEEELAKLRSAFRDLQEEKKRKDLELTDLKCQLSTVQTGSPETLEANAEDERTAEIVKLKDELAIRDQQISDLQAERDADNARMQSVMDVQMAHEALRKICQEKDRQIQHLEEVLDQTIREKEHLSAGMINLREEINAKGEQLDRLEANFNEYQFQRTMECQYEDTCQKYVTQLNAMQMERHGSADYPGKFDNVFPTDQNNSTPIIDGTGDSAGSQLRYIEHGSGDKGSSWCQRCENVDVLTAEAARTIESLRSEYEIEIGRNVKLQQENDRLVTERERLVTELYGEMQNGAVSSLTCVLLAKKVNPDSDNSLADIARHFRCLKQELQNTINERDDAKARLARLISDFQQLSAHNHDLACRIQTDERQMEEMRSELKEKRKLHYEYLAAKNRCKALAYQKEYLIVEFQRLQNLYHDTCKRYSFNGLTKRNGDTSFSCQQLPYKPKNYRFRSAVFAVMAARRLTKGVEKKRKHERLLLSE